MRLCLWVLTERDRCVASKGKSGESVKLAASCSERENKKTPKNMFVHVDDGLTGPFSGHLSQS